MKETRTMPLNRYENLKYVVKCLICGARCQSDETVGICNVCKKAVMRIREQSTPYVMPNEARNLLDLNKPGTIVSMPEDQIIPYKEKTKVYSVNIPKEEVKKVKIKLDRMKDLEQLGFEKEITDDETYYFFHFSDDSCIVVDGENGNIELDWFSLAHTEELLNLKTMLTLSGLMEEELCKQ